MDFKILIDDFFDIVNPDNDLSITEKKKILSLINDFEDGEWRYRKFLDFIWNNIAETALSFKERESLIHKSRTQLIDAAKKLRFTDKEKDISKGSELSEILLYGIMKHHYNALPVVPKIYYKQNPNDNAKGADSVHIVVTNNDEFSIWFGEAKFYNSIEDARLYEIIHSVENSLLTEKLKKENSIITNLNDLELLIDNKVLVKKIKAMLSNRESIDNLKPLLHIPILLLYECEYTTKYDTLSDDYLSEIKKYHIERATSYFKKQIRIIGENVFKYSEIYFHLILFPVPNKEKIVKEFIEEAGFYQKK